MKFVCVAIYSSCTLFLLRSSPVALFSCCTFFKLHIFRLDFFPFKLFSCCPLYILHIFRVALFSVYIFHYALIHVTLISFCCCILLMPRCFHDAVSHGSLLCCTYMKLQSFKAVFFHAAIFSCCTLSFCTISCYICFHFAPYLVLHLLARFFKSIYKPRFVLGTN